LTKFSVTGPGRAARRRLRVHGQGQRQRQLQRQRAPSPGWSDGPVGIVRRSFSSDRKEGHVAAALAQEIEQIVEQGLRPGVGACFAPKAQPGSHPLAGTGQAQRACSVDSCSVAPSGVAPSPPSTSR
jgi:hypothetical protein